MLEKLREDLIEDEGLRNKVYKCTMGKDTIAVGRNLDDVPLTPAEEAHLGCKTADLLAGSSLTDDQCKYLLDNDIARVCKDLDRELPWWRSRPDDVQRGMANMAYQLGVGGLEKFKNMLSCLQAGDYEGARKAALDSLWAKQTPKRADRVTALFTAGHPFN